MQQSTQEANHGQHSEQASKPYQAVREQHFTIKEGRRVLSIHDFVSAAKTTLGDPPRQSFTFRDVAAMPSAAAAIGGYLRLMNLSASSSDTAATRSMSISFPSLSSPGPLKVHNSASQTPDLPGGKPRSLF